VHEEQCPSNIRIVVEHVDKITGLLGSNLAGHALVQMLSVLERKILRGLRRWSTTKCPSA
jgi:hypothetical protein